MKVCKACKVSKPESEYHRKARRNGVGLTAWCKVCVRARDRQRSATEHHRATRRAWYKRDPRKAMLVNARQTAEKRGVPFALTEDDIHIPTHCPVLGTTLKIGDRVRTDASPSIDRFKPTEGYVPHNIRIISWRANRIKCDATVQELELILAYMRGEALF